MTRLNVLVEGQTEQTFVRDVLQAHLARHGVFTSAKLLVTSRKGPKVHRGGITTYARLASELARWLKQDNRPDARFTTMIDLYGLPSNFPGYDEARPIRNPHDRVRLLESRFAESVGDPRFLPHLQLHEFEAFLFADVTALAPSFANLDVSRAIERLALIAGRHESPEHIDDGAATAPSKRIIEHVPAYRRAKVRVGAATAARIGLDKLRAACRHFDEWLNRLEQLGA